MKKASLDIFFDKKDDWSANYNNMDFFLYKPESRLRWCLVDADFLEDNPFAGCVDLDTLEIKNQEAFDLMINEETDLVQMVEDKGWDWLGDDFEHMEAYLSFIMQHDRSFCYSVKGEGYKSDSDYLHIETWSIPEKFLKSDDLRDAYIAGSSNQSGDYYMDSDNHGY